MQSPVKTVHYKLRCLLVAGLLTLPAGKLVAGVPIDRIIAVVEDDIVMVSELEAQLRTVRAQMRQQGISNSQLSSSGKASAGAYDYDQTTTSACGQNRYTRRR